MSGWSYVSQSKQRLDKYVVNVSSMEGKFTRPHKDHRHPHTNMAKAALNMMTCTMAADYARDNIYINSVDTGWYNFTIIVFVPTPYAI
jgi:NAD(P)-dependent dehydrogenase (short-subunit alcohol dehydrogenase family)